jgi:hypothetical protein
MNEASQRMLVAAGFAAIFVAGGLLLKFETASIGLGAVIIFVLFSMAMFRDTIKLFSLVVLFWGVASLLINLPGPYQVAKTAMGYIPKEIVPPRQSLENERGSTLVQDLEELKVACDRGLLTVDECATGRSKLLDKRLPSR